MMNRKTALKVFAAAALVFASTLATLLSRSYDLGPARPAPAFRAFGPENAKIRIEEFTDLSCPACRTAQGHVMQLLKLYPGSIRLDFKHHPLLELHPWALHAAVYSDCAGRQGKFEEYTGLLFENQEKWSQSREEPVQFAEYVKTLGLDAEEFRKCADDPAVRRQVEMDIAESGFKGVDATPTFFINGKRAVGGLQLLEQARHFDNLLKE
ncbi:MAG TPA: thioredoxin domain-containing protein [Elusimicrobiales bacterium]|nr:thioredoxin domain-containing protein [Elusimicrobiales bacterium]